MYGYIYETTNLINGKKYIGKHKASKFDKNYYGSGIILNKALIKYGRENFKIKLLKEINTNQKDLDELETYYIKKYNAVESMQYYNKSYGGESEGWYNINKARKVQPNKFELFKRIWITNNNEEKLIKIEDFDFYKNLGYIKGRYKKSYNSNNTTHNKLSSNAKNRKWINKNKINKFVKLEYLNEYLNNGWNLGRYFSDDKLKEIKNSISKSLKGKTLGRHLNQKQRDYISKRTKQCLKEYIKIHGKLKPANTGKIGISNKYHKIYINKEELNMYLNKGYTLGFKRKESD